MKQLLSLLLFISALNGLKSQVYVYPDRDIMFSQMVCNVNGGHILPEDEIMWNKALLTCDSRGIYEGFSTSSLDLLYRYENNQLYLGNSIFTSDIMYTFSNGVIYRGDSTFPLDKLFSFKGGHLYAAEGESVFDILLTFDGNITVVELFGVLLAMDLM